MTTDIKYAKNNPRNRYPIEISEVDLCKGDLIEKKRTKF